MAREKRLRARKKPSQRRSAETVDAILEAAARILVRNGYAKTTTNQIAEKAGISVGSLYQYFPGKDAILVALVERHMDRVHQVFLRALAQPLSIASADGIEELIAKLIELHEEQPELDRILLEEVPLPPETRERLEAREEELARQVEATLRDAGLKDSRLLGWLLVHAIESLAHHWTLHPPRGVGSERFRTALATALAGLCRAGS